MPVCSTDRLAAGDPPVRSPQSNGMAESFVKTIKRDYVAHIPKPDRETALRNLANPCDPAWSSYFAQRRAAIDVD
ncbi:hypothetical protein DENIT_30054 [Pseudomonas veronii]|nr:hypothetical protein DENIT_30054 [Pseudomonas veronii]